MKVNYKPDLEGIKFFAVLSIVLYNLDVKLFDGGFIGVDILFLIILKYLDFLILNINYNFNTNLDFVNLPFPLAISFITFQTIAYLVDCYDGNIKKNNIIEYSLFIIFFLN